MNEYAAEVERISGNVASTYTALSEMGAAMPAQQNSDNLPGTVRTVPQGGGSGGSVHWDNIDGKPIVVVGLSFETMSLTKTPAEILELQQTGSVVLFSMTGTGFAVDYADDEVYGATSIQFIGELGDGFVDIAAMTVMFDANGGFMGQLINYIPSEPM